MSVMTPDKRDRYKNAKDSVQPCQLLEKLHMTRRVIALQNLRSWPYQTEGHLYGGSSLLQVPDSRALRGHKVIVSCKAVHAVVDRGLVGVIVRAAQGPHCPRAIPYPP